MTLLFGAATYVVDHYSPEMVFAYDLDVDGDVVSVSATPQEDNTVDVSGVREEYEAELALAEFLDNVRGDPTLTKNTSRFQGVGYFMVIYPAIVLLFVGFLNLEVRRDRALRRIIGVDL